MKLSWGLTLSSLCSAASAAREAHVYMYDATPGSPPQAPSSVAPEIARLILARRMGLSDFHSLDKPSEGTIRNLNVYGGNQPKLFAGRLPDGQHSMLWIDDVDDLDVFSPCFKDKNWMKFTISEPPSTADNERLIEDMAAQANSLSVGTQYPSYELTESKSSFSNDRLVMISRDFKVVKEATKNNECPFGQVDAIPNSKTVVLMPPSSPKTKRRVQPYGKYTVPSSDHRREVAEAHISKEAPLSLASTKPGIPDDLEDFPVVAAAKGKGDNTTAPLGILKTCYESQSKCVSATNGCTGHGECKNRNGGKKERGFDCWHCVCSAEVKMHDGKGMETGKKTTYWGGPACQKKDISVPFWLLGGSAVLFAFLISSGIGLMYSMGSEELPSVIGAGVSGPSRK